MKTGSKLTPKGTKIVAALERFRDAIESGAPIEQRYTVRRVKLDLTPRTFGPDEVKGIRAMMGVSQPIFGQFLGVDVKTVRSWEQGRRSSVGDGLPVPGGDPGRSGALARPPEGRPGSDGRVRVRAPLRPVAHRRDRAGARKLNGPGYGTRNRVASSVIEGMARQAPLGLPRWSGSVALGLRPTGDAAAGCP